MSEPDLGGASRLEPAAVRPADPGGSATYDAAIGAAVERLVQSIFRVGLILAGCRPLVDEQVATRLGLATDILDRVIRDLRVAAMRGNGGTCGSADADARDDLLDRLGDIADTLHLLALAHPGDGARSMQLGEAAHHARRAWVTLRDELHS